MALLTHEWQSGLSDPERTEDVRLELVACFLLGDFFDHSELAVTSIVDDDVKAPERLMRSRDSGEVSVSIVDIQFDGEQVVAVFVGQVFQRLEPARRRRHLVTAVERCDRPLPAETARSSSDEPVLCHASTLGRSSAGRAGSADRLDPGVLDRHLIVGQTGSVMTIERTLILLRHAKSDWSGSAPDFDRPLAERGRAQAPLAGRWLANHVDRIDLAIVSPAERARETWELASVPARTRAALAIRRPCV